MKTILFVAVVLAVFAFISVVVVDDSGFDGFAEQERIMEAYESQ